MSRTVQKILGSFREVVVRLRLEEHNVTTVRWETVVEPRIDGPGDSSESVPLADTRADLLASQITSRIGLQEEEMLRVIWVNALRLCEGRHADAEDLVQDVYESLARIAARGKLPTVEHPGAWLRELTTNRFIDARRAASAQKRTPPGRVVPLDDALDASTYQTTEQVALNRMRNEELAAAVRELKQEHRDVIRLVIVEGLSTSEAARELCLPVSTVSSRLASAYKALRSRGKREGWEK